MWDRVYIYIYICREREILCYMEHLENTESISKKYGNAQRLLSTTIKEYAVRFYAANQFPYFWGRVRNSQQAGGHLVTEEGLLIKQM